MVSVVPFVTVAQPCIPIDMAIAKMDKMNFIEKIPFFQDMIVHPAQRLHADMDQ
jgi:hypothetical protein